MIPLKRVIFVDGVAYSVKKFSDKFDFSSTKVVRYYDEGLRGQELLKKLEESRLTYGGKTFKSKLQAAQYFGIPPTTFYRYDKDGDLEKLIKRKQVLDKYHLN